MEICQNYGGAGCQYGSAGRMSMRKMSNCS